MKIKYFYGLNGIRIMLALFVLVFHIELYRSLFLNLNFLDEPKFLMQLGPVCVSLFFVISGYLITYFLLNEKLASSKINYLKFYKGRIFRIWPLYYLTIFIYWIVLPNLSLLYTAYQKFFFINRTTPETALLISKKVYFILSLLFLPQLTYTIAEFIDNIATYATFTWSIGTEEFFYLIWPLILGLSLNVKKSIIRTFIIYFAVFLFLILGFVITKKLMPGSTVTKVFAVSAFTVFFNRISCMCIGAYGAYLLINKRNLVEKFCTNRNAIIALMVLLILFFTRVFLHEILCVLFIIVLLNITINNKPIPFLDSKLISYLGQVSYGVYMYHTMVIIILLAVFNKYNYSNTFLLYILSISITILISIASYEFFEKYFINLKNKKTT